MLAFVDDKKHYVNNALRTIKESLVEAMQKSMRTREELLMFVGGKLELSKCDFFLIDCSFNKFDIPFIKEHKHSISF